MAEPVTWHRDGCHQSTVLEMLERFRTEGHLCDVTLKIGDHSIQAHGLVLAASCPYFQAMFMGSMLESQLDTITMRDVDPLSLEAMVTYAYTASIKLDQENVESLLACASLLQVTSVTNACCQFLGSHLSPGNCLGVWSLAGLYSCHDLAQQALSYAQDHFKEVSEEAEFRLLTEENLEALISCDELVVDCEEQIFKAVMAWAKFDPSRRAACLWPLLKHVAFPLLSPEYLLDQIETEPILSREGTIVSHLVQQLQIVNKADNSVRVRGHRKKTKALLAIGGECQGCSLNSCHIFSEAAGKWSPTVPQPVRSSDREDEIPVLASMQVGRSAFGVACDGTQVYVAGGLSTSSDSIGTIEHYSVTDNTWQEAATMKETRHGCQACLLNNKVYIFGGHNGQGYSQSVECFSPATKACDYVGSLPEAKAFMGAVVLGGCIYVLGGTGDRVYHNRVHCYDPIGDRWTTLVPLLEPRAYVGAAVVNGCIYAIGGYNGKWLKTVEKYNPTENRWIAVASMKHERSSFGVSVLDGCIYIAGGFNGKRSLCTAAKYDPSADSWTPVPSIPGSWYGVQLASLGW